MWEISLSWQVISFLYALAVGVSLALFYDFFRSIRKEKKCNAVAVFFQDVFFWLVAAFVTFILLIARCNGEIRGYVLIGEVFGFLIYHFTLSRFIFPVFVFFINIIRKFYKIYFDVLSRFSDFLLKKMRFLPVLVKKTVKKLKIKRKNS
jgi:spore cortex biosynthesis protein YabQ